MPDNHITNAHASTEQGMNRKDFLKTMFYGAAVVTIGAGLSQCLGGCADSVAVATVDFTIDLSKSENQALTAVGGFLRQDGVLIIHPTTEEYIAVWATCTHEGSQVNWESGSVRFRCPNHGATFSKTGDVTGGPATTALHRYNVSLNGTQLRVFS